MTFKYDADGLLKVTAKDVGTGCTEGITIAADQLNLP